MKYLFHIHSNINLLTATLVVENEKLNRSDVVFILARGVTTDFNVQKIVLRDEVYYHPFNTLKELFSLKFLSNNKILDCIDAIIGEYVNDKFTYYCPNSCVPLYRAFYSNPNCVSVNYLEDGLDAYLSRKALLAKYPNPVPVHIKVANLIFRIFPVFRTKRLNYVSDEFLPNLKGYKSYIYCLSNNSYLNQDNLNKSILEIEENSYYNTSEILATNIFVFDAVKNQNVVEENDFYDFVSWFCKEYFSFKAIAIKFHPFQDEEEIERIITIFSSNNILVNIIDAQVTLEAIFIKKKDLNVYGIGSSLLLYATMFNVRNVHVLYPYFELVSKYLSPRLTVWNDIFKNRKGIVLLSKIFLLKEQYLDR